MKKNILKKLIAISYIISFLFILSLPVKINAQPYQEENGDLYYYAINTGSNTTVYGPLSSIDCEAEKNAKMITQPLNGFSDCEFINKTGMVTIADFKNPPTVKNSPIFNPVKNTTNVTKDPDTNYTLLAELPGLKEIDTTKGLGFYLNKMLIIFIGLCAVLAMIMIVWGGIQYMTSELISGKEAGRETLTHAILGLLLVFAAFTILNTLNPDLLDVSSFQNVKTTVVNDLGGFSLGPVVLPPDYVPPFGIYCPRSGGESSLQQIVASLADRKVTYRMGGKAGPPPYPYETEQCTEGPCKDYCPTNTLCLDCTGFVDYVLKCAGLNPPGGNASEALHSGAGFTKIDKTKMTQVNGEIYIDGRALKMGDILAWMGSGGEHGHAILYMGNGVGVDSHGGDGRLDGNGFGSFRVLSMYGKNITHYARVTSNEVLEKYERLSFGAGGTNNPTRTVSLIISNYDKKKKHEIEIYNNAITLPRKEITTTNIDKDGQGILTYILKPKEFIDLCGDVKSKKYPESTVSVHLYVAGLDYGVKSETLANCPPPPKEEKPKEATKTGAKTP